MGQIRASDVRLDRGYYLLGQYLRFGDPWKDSISLVLARQIIGNNATAEYSPWLARPETARLLIYSPSPGTLLPYASTATLLPRRAIPRAGIRHRPLGLVPCKLCDSRCVKAASPDSQADRRAAGGGYLDGTQSWEEPPPNVKYSPSTFWPRESVHRGERERA